MALTKVTYTDHQTVIGADNLNAIQDEIINKCVTVDSKSFTSSQKKQARQNIGLPTQSGSNYATCETKYSYASVNEIQMNDGANDIYPMPFLNVIAQNTDMNNLTKLGFYACNTTAAAGTLSNTPFSGSFTASSFVMIVIPRGQYPTQIMFLPSVICIRQQTSGGWGAWTYITA